MPSTRRMLIPTAGIIILLLLLSTRRACNFPQEAVIDNVLHGDFSLDAGLFLHLFEKIFQRLLAHGSVFGQSLQDDLISLLRDAWLEIELASDEIGKIFLLLPCGFQRTHKTAQHLRGLRPVLFDLFL